MGLVSPTGDRAGAPLRPRPPAARRGVPCTDGGPGLGPPGCGWGGRRYHHADERQRVMAEEADKALRAPQTTLARGEAPALSLFAHQPEPFPPPQHLFEWLDDPGNPSPGQGSLARGDSTGSHAPQREPAQRAQARTRERAPPRPRPARGRDPRQLRGHPPGCVPSPGAGNGSYGSTTESGPFPNPQNLTDSTRKLWKQRVTSNPEGKRHISSLAFTHLSIALRVSRSCA